MKPNGGGTFVLGAPPFGASDAVPPSPFVGSSGSLLDPARSPVRAEGDPELSDDEDRGHPAWAQGRLDGLTRLLDVWTSFMTLEDIARRVKECVAELCQGRVVHLRGGAWQTSLPAKGCVKPKAPRVGRSLDNRDLRDRPKAPWLDDRFPWPNGIEVPTRLDVNLPGAEASATTLPSAPSTTSLLGLPLLVEGRLLGVVVAEQSSPESSGKGPLSSEERAYYGGLAWVCAQAFERGRLQDEDLRARRRNHWLQRFTAAMSRSAAHADVAMVAMTMGLEALDAQDGELWFRREKDAETPWMCVHPAKGEGVAMVPAATASAAVEEVLRSREPTVLHHGSVSDGGAAFELDGESRLVVGVPLSVGGRSLGAWVFRIEGTQLLTETDKAFALAIVHQAALALERARLYEDAQHLALTHQRWAQRSNLLADLAYQISEATADFPRLMLTIVQFLARRFQGAGFLRLLDDDGARFGHVVAWHDDESLREKMRLAASVPSHPTVEEFYASAWLHSETPVWFPRLQEEIRQAWFPEESQPFLREVEPQDLLVAPLRCRGIIRGVLGFFRLPGQPMLTEADRALLEEIAARVAMALDNARLLRAREEAVQLRDDFLSIAGHELKTPLTSLMLQAAALSKGARGDAERAKLAERADRMAVSGGRLAKLIDELLDVSRLGAGRFTLEREPLDLRTMVAECLDQMRDDIARSKCDVALTQAGEVQGAWDRARILQVIGNLLSNALKYGPGRPIQVHLQGDPRCVRLSVRDHGIGIAVEDQARIFHRFERAVSPRHFGGLGLGLWIVRLVVEAHGGNIRVESLPQQGSCFEVTLPRAEQARVHREELRPWHTTGSLEEHGSR